MQAEFLMINDLVQSNKGEIIKVESISTKRQHRKVGYHRKCDMYKMKYIRQGQISPIILTSEIIKKNDFYNQEAYGYQRIANQALGERHLTMYVHDDAWVMGIGFPLRDDDLDLIHGVKYVHEWQQLLRRCGMKDLANNIKI